MLEEVGRMKAIGISKMLKFLSSFGAHSFEN